MADKERGQASLIPPDVSDFLQKYTRIPSQRTLFRKAFPKEEQHREEIILPRPLQPVEFTPEYATPKILTRWGDGAMIISVPHKSKQHIKEADSKCGGEVVLPIPKNSRGDRQRFCNGCKKEVTVMGLGALVLELSLANKHLHKNGNS